MKKAMNQSKLILILNGLSILSLLFMVILLFIAGNVNRGLTAANENRFNLTYNANRFMNGSAYLTNEVGLTPPQETRNTMTITGMKSIT